MIDNLYFFADIKLRHSMVEMFPLTSADAAYNKISGMLSTLGYPFILPVIPILSQTVDTLTRLIEHSSFSCSCHCETCRVEYENLKRFGSAVHLSFCGCGNSRSCERTSASHANGIHHQQQPSNPPGTPPPIIPLVKSSNRPRGLATSQSDQSGGFFNFPPRSIKPKTTWNRKFIGEPYPSVREKPFASSSCLI
ncbi:hypothetical protein RHSIM_Rhsim10G0031700 [Rhododendron simsii]|uniref:Uncharacterized protein n=1 Tax=Rhododendron simsii TaxID=118357 RepID=A0A834GE21_RHOSS|nr:hypothetical protein RHSIM_Rhsim10G0031700 [Rhododendron simsii]